MRKAGVGAVLGAVMAVGCAGADDVVGGTNNDALSDAPACLQSLGCAPPSLQTKPRSWRHRRSMLTVLQGAANHRGRDLFVNPDAPQTIIAQFAYGLADTDLADEEVDVYVQRDCAHAWEKLGTTLTTENGANHAPVEGVGDHGGRVYFEIPAEKRLGPGMFRVRLVVAGDGTSTDLSIDVVPRGTPIFVSDVDGTLTSSESVEFTALLTGRTPDTHPGASEALRALAEKGYRPIYLTARPEWLTQRTREFLEVRGFPRGIVHTSLSALGAGFGAAAADFKKGELDDLRRKGLTPSWGFGNKPSDSDAYASSVEAPEHRVFYKIDGAFVGRSIQSYVDLAPELRAMAPVCR